MSNIIFRQVYFSTSIDYSRVYTLFSYESGSKQKKTALDFDFELSLNQLLLIKKRSCGYLSYCDFPTSRMPLWYWKVCRVKTLWVVLNMPHFGVYKLFPIFLFNFWGAKAKSEKQLKTTPNPVPTIYRRKTIKTTEKVENNPKMLHWIIRLRRIKTFFSFFFDKQHS